MLLLCFVLVASSLPTLAVLGPEETPWLDPRGAKHDPQIFDRDPLDLLPAPGSIKASKVLIEVGLSWHISYFDRLATDENLLLIGCEPNPDNLQHFPKHPRLFVLPVAVANVTYSSGAPPERLVLHRTRFSPCSSLMRPAVQNGDVGCENIEDSVDVPAIPLFPVLERALTFGPIELVELDTQGTEIDIWTSGGELVKHVPRVIMEIQSDERKDKLLYEGQALKNEVIERMFHLGFKKERCWLIVYQENCVFVPLGTNTPVKDDCWTEQLVSTFLMTAESYANQHGTSVWETPELNAHALEALCCSGEAPQEGCWAPPEFTKELCCIDVYIDKHQIVRDR